MASSASHSVTGTNTDEHQQVHLVLEPRPQHSVTWDDSVVDNEHMGKKKSKKC